MPRAIPSRSRSRQTPRRAARPAAVEGAARWDVLETYGTPFLYALFGRLSTGDYDVNSTAWQAISLLCLLASIVAIARAVGPVVAGRLSGPRPSWSPPRRASSPMSARATSPRSSSGSWRCSSFSARAGGPAPATSQPGSSLGLAIAFKPSLALVPAFLLALWLIDRRPQRAAAPARRARRRWRRGGAHRRRGVGVVPTVVRLGDVRRRSRLDLVTYSIAGRQLRPRTSGRRGRMAGPIEGGADRTGAADGRRDGRRCTPKKGGRRRRQQTRPTARPTIRSDADAFQRECLVLSAGIAVVLLASPLSWLYYYLLLVPVQLVLLARIGRGTSPSQIARWVPPRHLGAAAVVHPVDDALRAAPRTPSRTPSSRCWRPRSCLA